MLAILETIASGSAARTLELLNSGLALRQKLVRLLRARRLQGIYDVVEQSRSVTLLDLSGRSASVDTVQRVRFRQNHVTTLTEYAWGEGELWEGYRCSPGVPVDRYSEGHDRSC